MITNIKNTGYMYLSSNASAQTQNKNQTDFASVMEKAGEQKQDNSVKNNTNTSKADTKTSVKRDSSISKEETKPEKSVSDETDKAKNAELSDNTKTQAAKTDTKAETATSEAAGEADSVEDFTKAAENLIQFQATDNMMEQVLDNTAEQAVDYVAEKLQVSIEDIQASMEKLRMDASDLLDPQNLLKLIADVKQLKGPEELLTIPRFTETFKELNAGLKDILDGQEAGEEPEYISAIKQETAFTDMQESQTMTKNTSEDTGREQSKHHASAEEGVHTQSLQNNHMDNAFAVQQTDGINNKIQELLAERVDAQTSENIVKQVVEQVKLNIKTDVTSMQMQLYPEHLGKVAIQVVSKNGVLTAQIAAENEGARAALESQLSTLKESFDNQGLKVQSVEVMVSSRGFDQNNDTNTNSEDSQKQGKRVRKNLLQDLEGTEEDIQEEEDLKVTLGNTVSYTA